VRRFSRIVPPFAAMIVVYIAFGYFFLPNFASTLTDAAIAFGYLMNLSRAELIGWGTPDGISFLGHTWSLAIEEQFYLAWPWLFALLLWGFGVGWRTFWFIVALALAVWAWRINLTWQGTSWFRLYNGTDTRADALMIGCALAVWLRLVPLDAHPRLDRALARAAWPLLGLLAVVSVFFFRPEDPFYYYWASLLLGALPAVGLVIILTRPRKTVLHYVFEQPVLVFLGRIFYAMYLWHLPVFAIMNWQYGMRAGMRALIGFPLVLVLSVLSYVLIERHFMRPAGRALAARKAVSAT
jgi:peptidoglycan/LPS O-acetylase OafA/YrhL